MINDESSPDNDARAEFYREQALEALKEWQDERNEREQEYKD